MLLNQEKAARRNIPSLDDAVTYRIAQTVTTVVVYPLGSSYPICPRCNCCLDREYLAFCNCCGQRLSWKKFSSATVLKWRKEE